MRSFAAALVVFCLGLVIAGVAAAGSARSAAYQIPGSGKNLLQTQAPSTRQPSLDDWQSEQPMRDDVTGGPALQLDSHPRNESVVFAAEEPMQFGLPPRGLPMKGRMMVNLSVVVPERIPHVNLRPLSPTQLVALRSTAAHLPPQVVANLSTTASALIAGTPLQSFHRSVATNGLSRPQARTVARPGAELTQAATGGGQRAQSGPNPNLVTGAVTWTGLNAYWRYEEDAMGGVGKYLINTSTGNLLLQSVDMNIPNKGVDLTFQRSFNSLGQHTYGNADGSGPSLYGDNWTSTFDVRIAYNSMQVSGSCGVQQGISVFDIDGARYDYSPNGGNCQSWTAPAGQFGQLFVDPNNPNYIDWLRKTGAKYVFYSPNQPLSAAGVAGAIYQIVGRNNNDSLTFSRTWSPDETDAHNLWSMTVATEDGRAAILQFANFTANGGQSFRLLHSLTWPDGTTTVQYAYQFLTDNNNHLFPMLWQVTEPSDGAVGGPPTQEYDATGPLALYNYVDSPRWVGNAGGPRYQFRYVNKGVVNVSYFGDVNPVTADGTGTYLQPDQTQDYGISSPSRTITILFPAIPPGQGQTATTTWSDNFGHRSVYTWDSFGRVVKTTDTTGDASPGPATVVATQAWDQDDDMTSSTDANQNETDYAYDANGNTIAVALPAPSPGSYRPTRLVSYDLNSNVLSSCDPVYDHLNNKDWNATPAPSDSLCPVGTNNSPSAPGPTQNSWTTTPSEPFGELHTVTTALGYVRTFAYDGYGEPTSITGASITETAPTAAPSASPIVVFPQVTLTYDAGGDVVCSSDGVGTWAIAYDIDGRVTAVADPDDGSSLSTQTCQKPSNLNTIVSYRVYYPDGQLQYSESPYQHYLDNGNYSIAAVAHSYDLDGNETAVVDHFDDVAGTTNKWYDGMDRLVEIGMARDTRTVPLLNIDGSWGTKAIDVYSYQWLRRYFYDLGSGTDYFNGSTIVTAHGNLFKTQEWLAQGVVKSSPPPTPSWMDVSGNGFDALDRTVAKYSYLAGTSTVETATNTFDGVGALGFLTKSCDALAECSSHAYDNIGRLTQISFSNTTPTRTYGYDADGRTTSISSASSFGTQTYSYDAEGRVVQASEPMSGGVTDPSNLAYTYYGNGWRQSVSVSPEGVGGLSQQNLLTYRYQLDGRLSDQYVLFAANAYRFGFTYTAAGREMNMSDPDYATAHSYSYDYFGRPTSFTIPQGSYSNFTYDAEGETKSFTAYGGVPVARYYSDRGDLSGQTISSSVQPSKWPQVATSNADGVVPVPTLGWDARSGAIVTNAPPNYQPYDAAGREVLMEDSFQTCHPQIGCDQWQGTENEQYDAEGHMLGAQYNTWNGWSLFGNPIPCGSIVANGSTGAPVSRAVAYNWGPNGHPAMMAVNSSSSATPAPSAFETLHWDGNTLLFTTNSSGVVDDVKVGFLADIVPNGSYSGMTVWDREPNGMITSEHNTTGYGSWIPPQPYHAGCTAPNAPSASPSFTYSQPAITEPGIDGIYDGYNVIQGTRTYDPSTQMWTAPDPFAGVADNPTSQLPYVYNGNNPLKYVDPSGFSYWSPGMNDSGLGMSVYGPPLTDEDLQDAAVALAQSINQNETTGYSTPTEAAGAAGREYNQASDNCSCEYGGDIYTDSNGRYHYELQGHGPTCSANAGCGVSLSDYSAGGNFYALWHVHPSVTEYYTDPVTHQPMVWKTLPYDLMGDISHLYWVSLGVPVYSIMPNGDVYLQNLLNTSGEQVCSGCAGVPI